MNGKQDYVVQVPLTGSTDQWFDVARAVTPEGAAELVRVLLTHRSPDVNIVRVEVRPSQELSHVL